MTRDAVAGPPAPFLRVLVAGHRPGARGGIGSVQSHLVEGTAGSVALTLVQTFSDDGPRWREVAVMVTGLARAATVLLRREVDVAHLHVSQRLSVVRKGLLRLVAGACGVPVVLHCHGSEFRDWFDGLPAPVRAVVRRMLRADRVVVLSELLRDEYARRLRVPRAATVALPNPVDWPERLPAPDGNDEGRDGRIVLAFLGRFGHRKGIDDLLAALTRLDAEVRGRLRLRAAGDGEIERVRDEVVRLGLDDVVEVSSWLDPPARDRLLADAEVLVLPSRNEGLPMSVLEAMAWAVVPVVTPVGGLADLVRDGENGRFVGVGDPDAIAEVLTELVAAPVLRARLASQAREDVRRYATPAWSAALVRTWSDAVRTART